MQGRQSLEPSYDNLSVQELVRMAVDGDQEAFWELYRRHSPLIFSRAYRLLGSREDAEDVLQNTFMIAWDKLAGGMHPDDFAAWLHGILRHTVWSAIRKRKNWEIFKEKVVHLGDFLHRTFVRVREPDAEDGHFVLSLLEQTVPQRVGSKIRPVAEYMFEFYEKSGDFPSVRDIEELFAMGHGTAQRWRQQVLEVCQQVASAHGFTLEDQV
jgi:RNA polymerase sigma factor (sigma-70 family)